MKMRLFSVIFSLCIIAYPGVLFTQSSDSSFSRMGTPYQEDSNTILLEHFDGSCSASILAYENTGEPCGSELPSAEPNYRYVAGMDGMGQALELSPPDGEPAGSATYLKYAGQLLSQPNGTVEFWVYLTTLSGSLIDQGPYFMSCTGWTFGMGPEGNGKLSASFWPACTLTSGIVTLPLNTWSHVAVSWGSHGAKMYINKKLVGSDSYTNYPAPGWSGAVLLRLAAHSSTSNIIDELRISNIQRDFSDIIIPNHVPGDYNGDGTADIAIYRPASGLWAIKLVSRVYFGGSDDLPVPCDYTGDATTDIGIFRPGSGLWAIRALTRVYFGSSADIPIPGDYDGDGDCDMAIFRPGSGLWAVRGITRFYFGSSSDNPVPGDYNGDGSNIIAIFRPDSGLWAMRNLSRTYFGSDIDTSVPGDYNGDGTWEPGIFRPASGLWASRGVSRCYYGASGDFPLVGDIDGDGTNDGTIFRSSSGLWAAPSVPRAYYGSQGDIPVFGIHNSSTARPQPPVPGRKGKIVGIVTDADTGQPIMGVLVSWNPYTPSATTNSSGYYELTFVEPGPQSVTASLIGYTSSTQTCVVTEGATTTLNFSLEGEGGDCTGTWSGSYTRGPYTGGGGCTYTSSGTMTLNLTQNNTTISGSGYINGIQFRWIPSCEHACYAELNGTASGTCTNNQLSGHIYGEGYCSEGSLPIDWDFNASVAGNTMTGTFPGEPGTLTLTKQ